MKRTKLVQFFSPVFILVHYGYVPFTTQSSSNILVQSICLILTNKEKYSILKGELSGNIEAYLDLVRELI